MRNILYKEQRKAKGQRNEKKKEYQKEGDKYKLIF